MSGDDSPKPKDKPQDSDVVLLHSPTADGEGVHALRARGDRLELAEIRPVKSGQPIVAGEVARLNPREDMPLVYDVEVSYEAPRPPPPADHSGPSRASSTAYRRGWDTVFKRAKGRRLKKHELN
jgi:hypothetical protein